MSELRKRAQYTPEFKMESVRQILSDGLSIVRAADQLGIPNGTLSRWVRQPALRLIFRSDRGSQYCSSEFQQMLKQMSIQSICE